MADTAQKIEDGEQKPVSRTPAQVLQEKMDFYHNKAEKIITKIIEALKENNTTRGDLLAMLYKEASRCNDIAIDCAAKLAPYKHPKLESVEVKKETVHRFVMRSPTIIADKQDWLNSVGHVEDANVIDLQPIKNKSLAESEQTKGK